MQTSDRGGIICDYCGTSHINDFIYYSFDFRYIITHGNQVPSLQLIHNADIISSYDICPTCFSDLSNRVVDNYKKLLNTRNFVCELTGKKLSGNLGYYYCVVAKVTVRIAGQPGICTKCQTKTSNIDEPCRCGNISFIRPALINTIMRFLEFSISEEAFQVFRQKIETVRQRPSSWTTNS